jgi:hypothetical protein
LKLTVIIMAVCLYKARGRQFSVSKSAA